VNYRFETERWRVEVFGEVREDMKGDLEKVAIARVVARRN
jgi:hypothetical protein